MIRHRYRKIVLFFARIISSFIVWDLVLPRLGLGGWSSRTRSERLHKSAHSFRILAIEMGGVMIKVGQFLSSRVDVLPTEVTDELEGLQDEVPPENFADMRRVAEREFGQPLSEKFANFEETPLAAASLGQVHRAKILQKSTPTEQVQENVSYLNVVVKIQRPNIENIIATDLAALKTVGGWLQRYKPIRRRANIPALLAEFTKILYEEIDYLAEGRNAETFAANFQGDPGVRVPKVIWTHTTRCVLTLENVWGIKISDYTGITAAGIDRGEVASRLIDTYLKQIFEDRFFHADPHPGNLFVNPLPVKNGSGPENREWRANVRTSSAFAITFVDFGMVGHIPPRLFDGLREMLIAVGTKDPSRMVKAYQMIGVLLPSADLELLEKAGATLFERYWGRDMRELQNIDPQEIRDLAGEFRQLIYSMPFQIPSNIIFLGRAVGILSGICTGLDPQFNVWQHLAPYAQKLISEEVRHNRQFWLDEVLEMARSLLTVPVKMDAMLAKMERGEIAVRAPEVVRQVTRLEIAINQLMGSIIFLAFLVGGILLVLEGQPVWGDILIGGAVVSILWILFRGRNGS